MTKQKKNLIQRFFSLPLIVQFIDWTKRTSLPGFDGIPMYNVVSFIFKELKEDNITGRANSMAFSFLLAFFPASVVIFTYIPTSFISGFEQTFEETLFGVLPEQGRLFLESIITDIKNVPRGGVRILSIFLALFFASNGMMALMRGFNKNYEITFFDRNALQKRWTALKLTILLGILAISSVVLIILGRIFVEKVLHAVHWDQFSILGFQILKWLILIILYYMIITTIYRMGTSFKRKLKWLNAGATLAALFSIITSLLFAYFVNNFGTYNKLYGSIGALISIMIWLQINSFILIVGFELNASIRVNRDLQTQAGG
ncbi:MAG: YihY/virulence factor BrkB family protein [Bacteroidota bacterium]